MTLLLILAAWFAVLTLIVAVCAIARIGDRDLRVHASATVEPAAETALRPVTLTAPAAMPAGNRIAA
jgi:hypothetical protein